MNQAHKGVHGVREDQWSGRWWMRDVEMKVELELGLGLGLEFSQTKGLGLAHPMNGEQFFK